MATSVGQRRGPCCFPHGQRAAGRSDQDITAILVFLPVALLTNLLVGQARLRAADTAALAGQQAAARLRSHPGEARGSHLPTRVTRWPSRQLAGGLGMDHVGLLLYQDDGTAAVLAFARPTRCDQAAASANDCRWSAGRC